MASETDGLNTYNWFTGSLPDGVHTIAVQAVDPSGNTTTTPTRTVVVSNSHVNLLPNPSLESANGSTPTCWLQGGFGTNTVAWTHTTDAHTGSFAENLNLSSWTSGDRKLIVAEDSGACAPAATPGHSYTVTGWYKVPSGTASPKFFAYYRTASGTWTYWTESQVFPSASSWTQVSWSTPALPAGVTNISVGMGLVNAGSVTMDDLALTDNSPPPDTTPPTSSIACNGISDTAGCASGWYGSSVQVSLSATDNLGGSGLASIRYTTDGSDPSPTNGTAYSGPFTVSSTSTVKYRAYDNAGNAEAVHIQRIQIDTDAPSSTIACNGAPCQSGWSNASASVTLTATDTGGAGVAFIRYTTDGSDPSLSNGSDYVGPFSVSSITAVKYRAYDNAGNPEPVNSQLIQIDSTPPTSTIRCDGALCSSTQYAGNVDVPLSATDNGGGAGIAAIYYTTDGSTPVASIGDLYVGPFPVSSTTTVKYFTVDNPGNVEPVNSQTINIAASAVTLTSPSDGAVISGTTNLTATVSGIDVDHVTFFVDGSPVGTASSAPYTVPWDSTTVSDGSHTIVAAAIDGGGVETDSDATTVSASNNGGDTTPPTSTIQCNAAACGSAWFSGSVSVALSASDDAGGSGVASIRYTTDGSDPSLSNGTVYSGSFSIATTTTVKYRAFDNAGNAEPVNSQLIQVDTVAPHSSIACNGTGCASSFYKTAVSVSLAAADNTGGSGVAAIVYTTDGSTPTLANGTVYTGAFSISTSTTIRLRAVDAAGNAEPVNSALIQADITPPTSAIVCNGGSCSRWLKPGVAASLSAVDNGGGSGVASIRYTTDGSTPTSTHGTIYTGPFTISATTTVKYRAFDNVGNTEGVNTQVVQIDGTAPTVSLISPTPGPAAGTVSLTANASDDVAVDHVDFLVDGAVVGTVSSSPYTVAWDSRSVSDGTHTITARAVDLAGNSASSSSVSVTVTNNDLLQNPSLETAAGTTPTCWLLGGFGTNTFTWTYTSDAHTGTHAENLNVSSWTNGDRKLVNTQDAGTCAPVAYPGGTYTVTAWYKAPAGASGSPVIYAYYRNSSGNWVFWNQSAPFASNSAWTQAVWTTPVLPAGATNVSVGMGLETAGSVTIDDLGLFLTSGPPPSSTAAASAYSNGARWAVSYTASDPGGPGLAEVDLYAKAPGDSGYTKVASDTSGAGSGSFAYTASAGDGSYSFYTLAIDNAGNSQSAPNSQATVQVDTTAAITLSTTGGSVSSTVTVSGTGFVAASTVSATYDGASITLTPSATTDAAGTFSASFTVPVGVVGSHTIRVTAGGRAATANFTVTPAITLSPSSGASGNTDTISGTGFAAGKAITAKFNGSTLTLTPTTTTGPDGRFTGASYTVPSATNGANTVTVTDGTNSASATFTVAAGPSLALSPASGAAGASTQVTVSGSGYTASSAITVRLDGTTQTTSPATPATNASGVIPAGVRFTMPPSTGDGTHTVQVTAGSQTSSAIFTVAPAAPTSPTIVDGSGAATTIRGTNQAAVNVNVTLPSSSRSSDVVSVTLTDGTHTTTVATGAATQGAGTVTLSGIDARGLNDGSIMINASVRDSLGDSSNAATATTSKAIAPTAAALVDGSGNPVAAINLLNQKSTNVKVTLPAGARGGDVVHVTLSDATHSRSDATGTIPSDNAASVTVAGIDASGLNDGTNSIRISATVAFPTSGGTGTSAPSTTTTSKDTVPPAVSAINDAGATPTNHTSVGWTVTFGASVTGVNASDFSVVTTGTVGTPTIASVTGSGSSYTVTVNNIPATGSGTVGLNLVDDDSIVDAAGNPLGGAGGVGSSGDGSFKGQTYAIDTTAPAAPVITSPANNGWSTAAVTLSGTAEPNSLITAFDNGKALTPTATTGAGGNWTLTVTGVAAGAHPYTAKATDAAGNQSPASAIDTVNVDTTAPTVGTTSIAKSDGLPTSTAGNAHQGGGYFIYANASDNAGGSGIAALTADVSAISGAAASSVPLQRCTSNCTVNGTTYGFVSGQQTASSSLAAGTVGYTVAVTDVAGNKGSTNKPTVTVNNTPPAVSAVATKNGTGSIAGVIAQNDSVTFTFTKAIDGTSIVSSWAWNWSTAQNVEVKITNPGTGNDTLQVLSSDGSTVLPYGTVNLGTTAYVTSGPGTYVIMGTTAAPSTMTRSTSGTSPITVTLGARNTTAKHRYPLEGAGHRQHHHLDPRLEQPLVRRRGEQAREHPSQRQQSGQWQSEDTVLASAEPYAGPPEADGVDIAWWWKTAELSCLARGCSRCCSAAADALGLGRRVGGDRRAGRDRGRPCPRLRSSRRSGSVRHWRGGV